MPARGYEFYLRVFLSVDFRRIPKVAEYFRAIFKDLSIIIEMNLGLSNN